MTEAVAAINSFINSIVWGPFMLCLMLGVGVFFSIKLRFFQITHIKQWLFDTVLGSIRKNKSLKTTGKSISPFEAMTTALAGSIGTGNIVGVSSAISLGGAGAVLWMWIASVFGMATVFAENYLGIVYREKRNGKYIGGPMYYIEKGLHNKPLAVLFAVFCTLAALGMGNMTQANSAASAMYEAFSLPPYISGILLCILSGLIIFGGIDRISKINSKLIPIISVLYILALLLILIINIKNIPDAIGKIITEAFDLKCISGGFMGYGMRNALRYGISRGVFSNEAGLGSSPIVHSEAAETDPVRSGEWGIFQVFTDTTVMCTLMALCILTTTDSNNIMELCTGPFTAVFGSFGKAFISVTVFVFGFATLISWCYYGEKGIDYLFRGKYIKQYRLIYVLFVFIGSTLKIDLVWDISDTINGLMAVPNLAALILLSGKIKLDKTRIRRKTVLPAKAAESFYRER